MILVPLNFKKILLIFLVFLMSIGALFGIWLMKSMPVFIHEQFDAELFNELRLEEDGWFIDYILSLNKQPSEQVSMTFHGLLPPRDAQLVVYSGALQSPIYIGSYQSKIKVLVPTTIFDKDQGLDLLRFSMTHVNVQGKYESDTLEHQYPYKTWQKGKTVHVYFLPIALLDKQHNMYYKYIVKLK